MLDRWDPLILVHAVAATYALGFGVVQIFRRRKGDRPHRIVGWTWVVAMALVITTSFGIRTINGGFGWLHALSLFTAFTVTMGIIAARRHRVKSHRSFLLGSYFGLLGALIGVVAVPDRRIPDTAVHHPWLVAAFIAAIALTAAASVWGIVNLPARGPKKAAGQVSESTAENSEALPR
ncbi:DUF2306 domain-containing protein [Ruicaihuangia caeni]|uniref:DUF2306 domain-containing protein n=1 Tax=Ruicaihuangia caeni TaxID=3042517 RepID=A0AAW6T965_9MICO|nr:DUF2306 domain-containing protein [Klugiella sp. YN-L-19]MDI2098313.1 DUF2306 domain-containing protein [Klugiella sp. YN-L-19]